MAEPLPVEEPAPPVQGPDIATIAAIELNFYRAENERLILLLNFLQTPVVQEHSDDNVISAHNLATTAALQCIRTIASFNNKKQASGTP